METCPLQSSGPDWDRAKGRNAAGDWKAPAGSCRVRSRSLVTWSFVVPLLPSLGEGTSGSAAEQQMAVKAVTLRSALLRMRSRAVALPAAATSLRNSRSLRTGAVSRGVLVPCLPLQPWLQGRWQGCCQGWRIPSRDVSLQWKWMTERAGDGSPALRLPPSFPCEGIPPPQGLLTSWTWGAGADPALPAGRDAGMPRRDAQLRRC